MDPSTPGENILIDNMSQSVKIVNKEDSLDNINFLDIEQIGFIWKSEYNGDNIPLFYKFIFYDENINNTLSKYESLKEISEIVVKFPNLKYIDLITCELSDQNEWKSEFDKLKAVLNNSITEIRYSTNRTGSKMLKGDWILESHNVSILDEYFDSKEFEYNYHLAPSPMQTVDNFISKTNNILFLEGSTLLLTDDIEIKVNEYKYTYNNIESTGWVPINVDNSISVIDGNGYTITFINASTNTLLNTITSTFYRGGTPLEIKNIIINGANTLSFNGLVYSEQSNPANNVTVRNCGVTTMILTSGNGFIFGQYAGSNSSGSAYAINCYSTGNNTNSNGGLIFGQFAGYNYGKAYAIGCYSTGTNSGSNGGLIYGLYAGYNYGNAYAIGCYSTGNNTGSSGGNIYGSRAGSNSSGKAFAIGCYSTGNNSGTSGGLIFGTGAGAFAGTVYAICCFSIGNNTATAGGLIFGSIAAYNGGSKAYAISCYSIGNNSGDSGGNIFGYFAGGNGGNAYAVGCYSSGNNSDFSGGLIFGRDAATSGGSGGGNAYAIGCYTTGVNSGDVDRYIFGRAHVEGNRYAYQCYSINNNNTNMWCSVDNNNSIVLSTDTNFIPPDPEIYYFNKSLTTKEQLRSRFFSALPWDPFSPFKQKPFLLDWSICDSKRSIADISWYISYVNTIDLTTVIGIKGLFKNIKNKTFSNYIPISDTFNNIPLTISTINLYDMIYRDSTKTYLQYRGGSISNNTYRVSTQFPIISEFIDNTSINRGFINNIENNPFIKNFINANNYNDAKTCWNNSNKIITDNELLTTNI